MGWNLSVQGTERCHYYGWGRGVKEGRGGGHQGGSEGRLGEAGHGEGSGLLRGEMENIGA